MPKTAEPWSLTSLREKLIKIGAKVVSHGRYVTFQMAEVAVPRQMFQEILSLMPGCGHRRRRHDERWRQMQQTTAAEVRLDAGRAARFSASVRSTGGFDRLPRTRCAIAVAQDARRDDLGLATTRNPGDVDLFHLTILATSEIVLELMVNSHSCAPELSNKTTTWGGKHHAYVCSRTRSRRCRAVGRGFSVARPKYQLH